MSKILFGLKIQLLLKFLFLQLILSVELVPLNEFNKTEAKPFQNFTLNETQAESVKHISETLEFNNLASFKAVKENLSTFEKLNENFDKQNETQFRFVQAETTTMSLVSTGVSSTVPVEVTNIKFTIQNPVETSTVLFVHETMADSKFTNQLENTRETTTIQEAFIVEKVQEMKIDQPSVKEGKFDHGLTRVENEDAHIVQTTTEQSTVFSVPTTTVELPSSTTVTTTTEMPTTTTTVEIVTETTTEFVTETTSVKTVLETTTMEHVNLVVPKVKEAFFEPPSVETVFTTEQMRTETTTEVVLTTTEETTTTTSTTTESTTTTTSTTTSTPVSTTESTTSTTESTTTTTVPTTTETTTTTTMESTTFMTTTESTTTTTQRTTTESTTTPESTTTTTESTTTTTESTTTTTESTSTTTVTESTTFTTTTTELNFFKNETDLTENLADKIKFEVKNYTILSNNSFEPNSYSLRIRIKGFKWNEKFANVSSSESQELLRTKILPLLYKSLNLNPSEINEVKLLKLFKGSIQTDLSFKSNSTLNLNITTKLFDFNSSEPRMIDSTAAEQSRLASDNDHISINEFNITTDNKTEKFLYNLTYSTTIVAAVGQVKPDYIENTIEQLLKHAVLRHFDGKLKKLEVKITNVTYLQENCTECLFPMKLQVLFKSYFELTHKEITESLSEDAINKNKCSVNKMKTVVECSSVLKDSSSLIRLSDYWIELETVSVHNALFSLDDLLSYNPEWIIGLGIIGSVLAVFFIGCIVAICYTRRPYRRSSKIYELESAVRKNAQVSHIPSMYPATRAQPISKHKEVYY